MMAPESTKPELSPPLLDFDALLAPLPGDDAAGDPHAYSRRLRSVLDDFRKHRNAAADDGSTNSERNDWTQTVSTCVQGLQKESKDLRLAGHLAEAMLKLHGFAGLRDSLHLIRRMISECWPRLHPPLDNDPETRAAPLANILDDPDRGFCFPNSVRLVPILGQGEESFGVHSWKRLKSKGDAKSEERAGKVMAATKPQDLQVVSLEIDACLEELELLTVALDDKMGDQAPGMYHLGEAIRECQSLVRSELPKILPPDLLTTAPAALETAPSDSPDPLQPLSAATGTSGTPTPGQIQQVRSSAYAQLEAAADLLLQIEPHSPIPYLVKRAVSLGRLPFPQLARQVLREEKMLAELTREFGLPS
ncbi:type VI secretion system protein TssA [Lignipirellula cremea]|uniref:ImpA N-terminal domain-containing protein n=1 Tax=Lignipirellula cremea TaxID=2528010 RepID=A0A518DT46_9BACT|nr:type VI secretion system protein TssA [Lignipirellula cremea]QDU95009.1 hypothetical protein Pla8534_28190 [Lignipirellula cremea]